MNKIETLSGRESLSESESSCDVWIVSKYLNKLR